MRQTLLGSGDKEVISQKAYYLEQPRTWCPIGFSFYCKNKKTVMWQYTVYKQPQIIYFPRLPLHSQTTGGKGALP